MAPDKPNQKRKRGRPAGASKPDEVVPIRGGEAVQEIARNDNDEAQLAPKRRGRPRKSDESSPEQPAAEEQPPPQEEEAQKMKGRPRKNAETEEADGGSMAGEPSTQPADTSETAPRRRRRPARTQEIEPEAGDEETSTAQAEEVSNSEQDKRGRKPRSQQTEEEMEEASVREAEVSADTVPSRRGRPARAEVEQVEPTVEKPEEPATATTKSRGRPARNEEVEPEAEPANEEVEEPAVAAPKKRGRRVRTQTDEPEEAPADEGLEETTDTAPKRRGRPARTQEAEAEVKQPSVAETEESPNAGRKKRGRPTRSQDADPEEPEQSEVRPRKRAKAAENAEEQQQPDEPRQRGRPGKKQAPPQQEDREMRDAEPTEIDGQRRRGGRPSNEEFREEATADPEPQQKDRRAKNASNFRGRRGHVVQQVEKTQKEGQPSVRPGRCRKRAEGAAEPSPQSNQAEKRSRKGPRGSLTEMPVSEAQNQATNSSRKEKHSRKKDQPQAEAESEEPQSPLSKAPYRHLAPQTLNIPRSTIRSKWTPLDQPAISAIDNLILDSYIPVLESLGGNNNTRYTQSQTILRTFANRLHNKLVKGLPFPPATIGTKTTKGVTISAQEAELNFEKVLDASSHLQRRLDPLLHSVALLKAEKEKEEAILEQDYRNLRKLEENARAQARGWRERTKRDHVLAPGRKDYIVGEYDPDEEKRLEVVVKEENQVPGSVFEGIGEDGEEELLGLAKQIGNHMESMRGNLNQIDGVVPAIQKSRAALQGVLGKYLSEEAYEGVVLG